MTVPRPTHVVWITADHLRYDSLGCNGGQGVHTPHIDALAGAGVSFDRCYGQNPLCMPSRCSFMSGMYPSQTGVMDNGHCLDPEFRPLLSHAFRAGGYATAQIGKLHFQPHEEHDLDPRARHGYGFDLCWLSEEPGCYDDAYVRWLRGEHPELVATFAVPRPNSPQRTIDRTGFQVLDAPWQCSHSGWVAEQFSRFLTGWGGRSGNHFVHCGFYAPHPPLNPTREMFAPHAGRDIPLPEVTQEWHDKPEPLAGMIRSFRDLTPEQLREYRRHFDAMVTGFDLGVGRIVDALRRRGVLEDTLLVISSDHGDLCGNHGMILKGPSFYDELMRLPVILHWPRGLGAGMRRVQGLVEKIDILPTMLGLCGMPPDPVMSGRSLAEDLRAGRQPAGRDSVLALHGVGCAMLRTANHKLLRYPRPGGASEVLYDLQEDPAECRNRASDQSSAGILGELRAQMLDRVLDACRSPQRRLYRY